MRSRFFKLFESSHFNTGISITPFSPAHIVYLVLIFGGIAFAVFRMRSNTEAKNERVLRILAYALTLSYLSDFFMHEFVYDGLNVDKLPFHLCTVLCPLIAFTQFNKRCNKFAEPVAMLAIVGPLMYLTYPANIGSGEPWCYQAVQTMFFHGVELAWGVLCLTSGKVRPKLARIWQSTVLLAAITLWAKFGNLLYGQNWFFLEEDAFYIGLVASGAIPKWSLMIFTPAAVLLMVLAIYGIYIGLVAILVKRKAKTLAKTE